MVEISPVGEIPGKFSNITIRFFAMGKNLPDALIPHLILIAHFPHILHTFKTVHMQGRFPVCLNFYTTQIQDDIKYIKKHIA